jgi:hypothetical protein
MVRQAGFILRSAVDAEAAAKWGQKKDRRINLQKLVLTAKRRGSDRMLVDVAGPCVLPDASADADSVTFPDCCSSRRIAILPPWLRLEQSSRS